MVGGSWDIIAVAAAAIVALFRRHDGGCLGGLVVVSGCGFPALGAASRSTAGGLLFIAVVHDELVDPLLNSGSVFLYVVTFLSLGRDKCLALSPHSIGSS